MGSNLDQAIVSRVRDELPTLESLFEAAEAVDALMSHPGWILVARVLDAEVAQIDRKLDAGNRPLEHTEYALAHGRRGGLRGAEHAARAILEVAAKAHDEQRRKHEGAAEPSLEGAF